MKIESEIRRELNSTKAVLTLVENDYRLLSQIDMLSETGNKMRSRMSSLKGRIWTFEWMLQDE
ncbi:MAG: hypothetical protein JXA68_00210 [Ignavibacteriales bacterium]|nr:hypothetical protein [Ignavibacteriales bacterium]